MVIFHSYVSLPEIYWYTIYIYIYKYTYNYIHMGLVIPSLLWIYTVQYKNSRHVMDEHTP